MCPNKNDILTPSINLKYHLWVKKKRILPFDIPMDFSSLDPINLPVAATKLHSTERDRVSAWRHQRRRWPFRNNDL